MASQNQAAGRKRLVHHLDTPLSTTSWPEISQDDQDAILELLCSFLSPLGQHRRTQAPPSKGKRAAKRVRNAARVPSVPLPLQPKPELDSSIDVGFNSITRNLRGSSCQTGSSDPSDADMAFGPPYSMVFVARGNQASAFHCHFPQMVGASSQSSPAGEKIRLVGFSRPCSDRLSSALGISRVSSVAVRRAAPGAQALLAFVEQKVAPVDVPWMGEGGVEYCPTLISSTETTVGPKRAKQS